MTACDAITGLASNPSAPTDVLLRLLSDEFDYGIVDRITWRESLPDEVGEAMVRHPDRRVRRLLAGSWAGSPELKAKLLDGPESDALVVAIGAIPYRGTVAPLPAPLATHEDPVFRMAACRGVWSELSDDVRAARLADPDDQVREAAALHVMHEDAEQTAWLIEVTEGEHTYWKVLESGLLTRELAERLMPEDRYLSSLALNPTLPSDLAARLADHKDPRVRLAVSARPELTEEQRAAIDWTVNPEDRLTPLQWVRRARHDVDVLRRCAHSQHTWLRRSAAVCEELPEDCVQLLAEDADYAVRLLLAEWHPKAPPELLFDLYVERAHGAAAMLTSRPQFPSAGLAARCADAENPRERALALRDPDASPALVERLSRDHSAWVRQTAACDTRLPVHRVVELLDDPDVCRSAATNPLLPVAEMRALLDGAGVPKLPADG